jgi:Rrf2 family protein
MKFSRESEYGLKGLLFLAQQPHGSILPLIEISQASGLPRSFLAKIFQKFVQHGLVRSQRGRQRGYALAKPSKEISLKEVLEAVEGPDLFERCIFWNDRCSNANPCPLHGGWGMVKPHFIELMEQTTLDDLAQGRAWRRPIQRQRR